MNKKTFIIAEAWSNHNGSLYMAYKLIDAAKEAWADAVKFQIFKADKLYPKNCGVIEHWWKKLDLYDFFKKSEVDYWWILKLKEYCDKKSIIFMATPFDEESVDILEKENVSIYKIASMEHNHFPLLKKVAKTWKHIILSDWLATLWDIEKAIDTIKKEWNNNITVLHCVSAYPALENEYNLNFLWTIKNVLWVECWLSDHTINPERVPMLSVANWWTVIEKHFTLDKNLPWADHFFALNPEELKLMIDKVREVEQLTISDKEKLKQKFPEIMWKYKKELQESEKPLFPWDKRYIFAIKDIKEGELFTNDNIRILRAERFLKPWLEPYYFDKIIWKKCKLNISAFNSIQFDNII